VAITPEQAAALTVEELREIARVEAEIDAKLALHYQGGDAEEISITYNLKSLSPRSLPVLLDRFIKAGWQPLKSSDGARPVYFLKPYSMRKKDV
jgi:hypothetical protein